MSKIALSIGIIALMILVSSLSAYAFSLGILPISLGKEPEEIKVPEQVAADVVNVEAFDLSEPLTLKQCIDIALKNASELRTGQLDLMLEEMNVRDARSAYFPQIDTSGSYQFSDSVDFGWEKDNYDASVDARYTIWDHGRREGNLAQAKSRREAEYSRYDRTGQSLIYNVISAYYRILETEKLIEVDKESLERSKQNVEKIKAFVEAGIAIEADLARVRVQQASDELTVVNDLNNLELAKANLAVIMGLDPSTSLNVMDVPDYGKYMETGIIQTKEISIDDAVSQAFSRRPEIAEQRANQDALEWALTLAKLQTWPTINADCGYNVRLDDYLRERDAFKNYKSWDVSARASYTLFDGGQTRRNLERAQIALQRMNENLSDLERSIALEVHQSYLSLERARKSLDITSVQVEDAKMSLDVTQGRYDQQMIILLELLDAQARYARSLTNQVTAFYDYKIAERSLEKAMGVLQ